MYLRRFYLPIIKFNFLCLSNSCYVIILPVVRNYSKEKVTIYLGGKYVTTEHAPEGFCVGF